MKYLLYLFCILVTSTQLFGQMQEDPLTKLKKGNQRFVSGETFCPRRSESIRKGQIGAQTPFCAVLACSDSRVPVEIVFDQGIGDIFVVRVAGNVASESVIESLDFAVDALNVPLIVVMGHQNCGAVGAVFTHIKDKELGTIGALIEPAVQGKQTLKAATIANAKMQVENLKKIPLLQKIEIVPAYYDFETGVVEFLE